MQPRVRRDTPCTIVVTAQPDMDLDLRGLVDPLQECNNGHFRQLRREKQLSEDLGGVMAEQLLRPRVTSLSLPVEFPQCVLCHHLQVRVRIPMPS